MPDAIGVYAGAPFSANGTATGPAAGGIITGASLTLGIGRWEISVAAGWGSVAGVQDNIELKIVQGAPSVTVLIPLSMNGAAASLPVYNDRIIVVVYSGTATVSVNAIATDASGVYDVSLIARPLLV